MMAWTAAERRWRDTLLAALIPSGPGDGPPGLADVDTTSFWIDLERAAPPLLRLGLRLAVWVLTWLPLLFIGCPRRFSALGPTDRDRMLERVAASRVFLLRQLLQTLRVIACFAYFRAPEVRSHFAPNDEAERGPDASGGPRP